MREKAFILRTRSPEETAHVGEELGRAMKGGEIVAIEGPLGAGKTCLIQGVGKGLEVREKRITSPTFIFRHRYPGRVALYHLDLYRLQGEEDVASLGLLEDMEEGGAVAIEWAERARTLLLEEVLWVTILPVDENGLTVRELRFSAEGKAHQHLLTELKKRWGKISLKNSSQQSVT